MAIDGTWTFTEQPNCPIPFDLLEKLRRRKKLFDFNIISKDGCKVPANRLLLAMRFPRIADTVAVENRACMEWRRFNADIVEAAVAFAYTGRVQLTMSNVASLFLLSTTLGCSTLTSGCIEFLGLRLSEDSVDTFWSIANATMNRDLMRICVPLIAAKFDIFTARPVFYSSTDVEYLAFLLKSSQLTNVTEDSKLRVIATWFQTATTEDGGKCQIDCFKDLVESVDLNKVTLDVCANLCTSNLETGLSEECRGYLLSAWMSAKTSSSSTDVASSRRHAFRDYVVAYKLQPGVLMFEDILGETTDVNINFQVPSRRNCVVTFFKDSIYISGGMDSNGHSSNRVDRVNPFSGNVSSVSPMSHARYGHCAAANDQYLFVFGGYSGLSYVDECEKYDAIHNRWTRLPDMIATRSDAAAVNVPSVGIVVVGGYLGDINVKVDIVELLAPSTEGGKDWSWQTLAPMLQWRRSPAVEYFRGCIIVAGGNDGEHITVECLPMTPDCRYSSQWTQLAEVPHSRSGAISLAAFNGRLLFYNSNIWLKLETGFPFFVLKSYRGKDEVLEFLPESETNESELEEFTWKPLFTRVAYGDQRLLVLRKRL